MLTFPRETAEFLPLVVSKTDGTPVTDYQVSITVWNQRPTVWEQCTALDGQHGVMVQNLTPGTYKVWVKVTANPETPVREVCTFGVT